MYEFFEHTADLGLRARADSLPELYAESGRALFAALVDNYEAVEARDTRQLTIKAARHDELLHDWLAELLYLYDVDHLLLARFDVELTGADGAELALAATVHGEPIDHQRHELDTEIKAITWHGLRVEEDGDGWLAEVIVDL